MIEDLFKEGKSVQFIVDLEDLRQLFQEVSKGTNHHTEIEERTPDTNSSMTAERLISRKNIAVHLGVNPTTIWRWQKMGILKVYHVGRKAYYKVSELNALIEKHGL